MRRLILMTVLIIWLSACGGSPVPPTPFPVTNDSCYGGKLLEGTRVCRVTDKELNIACYYNVSSTSLFCVKLGDER